MKKAEKKERKKNKRINSKQEEQLFINPIRYKIEKDKATKTKYIKNFFISLILLIIISLIFFSKKILKYYSKDKNKLKYSSTSKYQYMLPLLTPDLNSIPKSIEEVFNARQIYISDVRITPDYIKYIRPINETEELKYKKRYSENETIVDKKLFEKRPDQYNYVDFCKININETLIDNKKIEYDNKPIISIVLPSYNKEEIILRSIRSIQNQNFKNIEIIIVNDCSTDNSSNIFNYLLETDPRIRIFHHLKNMGLFRSRLDGILYSRGKYILAFDTGDIYEDNYVLTDVYNIVDKYNLDSCKFLFRGVWGYNHLNSSILLFHVGENDKIAYGPDNIKELNTRVFHSWGNIWIRLVRANIYIKGFYLFNEIMLNVYKNMWEDVWYNDIVNKVSYSYAIIERIGYVYCQGGGEGTPKGLTEKQRSNLIREYVGFLCYDYNFCENKECKKNIIKKLRDYNERDYKRQLKNFRSHFEVLNKLLEALIKDQDINEDDKKYCEKLLDESKKREKEIKKSN